MGDDGRKRQIAVVLDTPVFARLWAEAQDVGVSVAEVTRRRIESSFKGSRAAGISRLERDLQNLI